MERVITENNKKCNSATSRLSYIGKIAREFPQGSDCVLPTAAEERSFDDALRHLLRLFPNKRGTKKACSRKAKGCRKECLKEILNVLQFMQRERFYDPPADDEIRYFLLIKKYIRAMITFFCARDSLPCDEFCNPYRCFSYSNPSHNVDELAEVNRYLADFSTFVSEMDITNNDALNVFSEELYVPFLERIEREIRDLEGYCIRIRMSILEKISKAESWESLVETYNNHPYNSWLDEEDDEEAPFELRRRLAKKCQVSKEDLPDYIASVERCRDIASGVSCLISARADDCYDLCLPTHELSFYAKVLRQFGWDALHALTLFKHERELYAEAKIKKRKHVAEEEGIHYEEARMKKLKCVPQEQSEKENLKILLGIIEDLRRIGDSDTQLDEEESALIYKIWQSVASSVHFFFSAVAYEQERSIIARGGLLDVRMIGVKTTETSDSKKKVIEVQTMIDSLNDEMLILSKILRAYGKGLCEKLGQSLHEKLMSHPDYLFSF